MMMSFCRIWILLQKSTIGQNTETTGGGEATPVNTSTTKLQHLRVQRISQKEKRL